MAKAKTTKAARPATGVTKRKVKSKATRTQQGKRNTQLATSRPIPKKEITGIVMLGIGIITLMYPIGITEGTFLDGFWLVNKALFGICAMVPPVILVVWGWSLLYKGVNLPWKSLSTWIWIGIFFCVDMMGSLIEMTDGMGMYPTSGLWGGAIGNFLARLLYTGIGKVGGILLGLVLLMVLGISMTRVSVRPGLQKAGTKVGVMTDVAREKVEAQCTEMYEHYVQWVDQRREEREAQESAAVYDQAKDPRYPVDMDSLITPDENAPGRVMPEAITEYESDDPRRIMTINELQAAREAAPGCRREETDSTVYERPDTRVGTPVAECHVIPEDAPGMTPEEVATLVPGFQVRETTPAIEAIAAQDSESNGWGAAMANSFHATAATPSQSGGMAAAMASVTEDTKVVECDTQAPHVEPVTETTVNSQAPTSQMASPFTSVTAQLDPQAAYEGATAETGAVAVNTTETTPMPRRIEMPYRFPSLSMLEKGSAAVGLDEEVDKKARLLESTLASFGVEARIINATKGPAVTRYELEPSPGTKVSKIVNLTDDIALALAATGIRMEAPIPGKAAIGIEIPNQSVAAVRLRDVLECDEFMKAKGGIPVGLGKDIAGQAIITDLAKMPHLLVAGSTGSGKSVCVNTLIASILFSRKPDDVKLVLIDPKMVELSNYNGIPHLMTPVVTDMKKAATVLRWAVREMDARYATFADKGVRDIKRFNELYPESHMPLVVIIIDELADLMMTSPADVEDSICRLAQKARAAGIHLVLATQRPSVDVITGTIKANVPSRISFAVSSQIDSRTILDMAGAEKLLGKGDMLFNPIGASKPVRIQGAFVSDDEVEALVSFIKNQGEPPRYDESILQAQEQMQSGSGEDIVEDELLYDAIAYVLEAGQASTSMLQRKMRVGFTRAGRLMDAMEQMKIVGPHMGSKPRDLLMSPAQIEELLQQKRG